MNSTDALKDLKAKRAKLDEQIKAAERLEEQEALSRNLYEFMHEAVRHCWMGKSWTPQQIREKGVELGLMIKKEECVYAYSEELKKHFG